jgi:transposase
MTLPYSGAIFIQAFPRECTETFLEGHRRAFEFFGGVPRRISYDNSAIAVIEVLQGRERKLTKEFLRLQSHYLFQEHFCLARRANEKGHVERLVGFARRNFLVPVPQVDSLATLNATLCGSAAWAI